MCAWGNSWGLNKAPEAAAGSFRISKVKVMDGAINAEMFNRINLDNERPKRPIVSADANGDELLSTVVDYRLMMDFSKNGETKKDSEAVSVMTRCGFIPL